jgi:hypothetical protein
MRRARSEAPAQFESRARSQIGRAAFPLLCAGEQGCLFHGNTDYGSAPLYAMWASHAYCSLLVDLHDLAL